MAKLDSVELEMEALEIAISWPFHLVGLLFRFRSGNSFDSRLLEQPWLRYV